jgi:hypothetical protein
MDQDRSGLRVAAGRVTPGTPARGNVDIWQSRLPALRAKPGSLANPSLMSSDVPALAKNGADCANPSIWTAGLACDLDLLARRHDRGIDDPQFPVDVGAACPEPRGISSATASPWLRTMAVSSAIYGPVAAPSPSKRPWASHTVAGIPLIAQTLMRNYSAFSAHTSAACPMCGYIISTSRAASTGSRSIESSSGSTHGALFSRRRSATRACVQFCTSRWQRRLAYPGRTTDNANHAAGHGCHRRSRAAGALIGAACGR